MLIDNLKGVAATVLTAVDKTSTSEVIDCTGFNAVLVEVTITGTGTWAISVNGSLNNSTFIPVYDGADAMSQADIQTSRMIYFKGIPDFIKIVATESVDGATCTVKVQPINI